MASHPQTSAILTGAALVAVATYAWQCAHGRRPLRGGGLVSIGRAAKGGDSPPHGRGSYGSCGPSSRHAPTDTKARGWHVRVGTAEPEEGEEGVEGGGEGLVAKD